MKLRDYLIIGGLLLVVSIAYVIFTFFGPEVSTVAHIYQGNQIVVTVDFEKKTYEVNPQIKDSNYPKTTEPIAGEGGDVAFILLGSYQIDGNFTEVIVEIDFDTSSIRIAKDDTPKQIGVNRNWYNGKGLPAISLPSEVFIVFEIEDDQGLDGVI